MQSKIGGIILAAGESKRMGEPKALLEFPDGETLLTRQARLLFDAGCRPVIAVVGADADTIIHAHAHLDVSWCRNDQWRTGQFSSIRAGISRIPADEVSGALILPVDAAGVRSTTTARIMREAAGEPPPPAVVPVFEGKGGHPVFISRGICRRIEETDPSEEGARLDLLLHKTPDIVHLAVDDRAVSRNINTLDEWHLFAKDTP